MNELFTPEDMINLEKVDWEPIDDKKTLCMVEAICNFIERIYLLTGCVFMFREDINDDELNEFIDKYTSGSIDQLELLKYIHSIGGELIHVDYNETDDDEE